MFGSKYTCSGCGRSFREKDDFDEHNEGIHDGDAGAMPG